MDYAFCLRPHENALYQQAECLLSLRELTCALYRCGETSPIVLREIGGAPFLCFSLAGELPPDLMTLSALYFAARAEGGALVPLDAARASFVPRHMPQVLKYKGKTNATFTALLIHLARCAMMGEGTAPLTLLDPLAGRGTSLYEALVEGMNAVGVEQDAAALKECAGFAERFFSRERVPYKKKNASRTLGGGKAAPETTYLVGGGGDTRTMTLLKADTRDTVPALKAHSADLLVADLPYGVQHAPRAGGGITKIEELLRDALPKYHAALVPGGGAALSFNTLTLERPVLAGLMEQAGFTVLEEPFTGFKHRVEQAVERDIVVARA